MRDREGRGCEMIRDLGQVSDRRVLDRLWESALAPTWPLLPAGLSGIRDGLVAEDGGRPIGVVAVDPAGSIPLIVVDSAHQRRGVGTALLNAALERLSALGARTASLGSGGESYIWPGVPDDLPAAVRFFATRGWRLEQAVIDLVADLGDYQAPARVRERIVRAGVTLGVAGEQELAEVLAFEAKHFPSWLRWFERRDSTVLVARAAKGHVVGSLLFRGPGPGPDLRADAWRHGGHDRVRRRRRQRAGARGGQRDGRARLRVAPRRGDAVLSHRLDGPRELLWSAGLRSVAALLDVPAPAARRQPDYPAAPIRRRRGVAPR